MATYDYYIDLDERGELFADVRDSEENTIFEIHGFWIFEDGFMRSRDDMSGLECYLESVGIIGPTDSIVNRG